ncbi:MAG: hypothetical protein CFE32_02880 [Alphaproteobacteria bacterium PA3]|nr:MAG: hypothetical protein CFE32_02880 [Alphaproteobacteria bacterium PA3]
MGRGLDPAHLISVDAKSGERRAETLVDLRSGVPDRLTPSGMTAFFGDRNGCQRAYDWKHPFTGFAGIGVYADTP